MFRRENCHVMYSGYSSTRHGDVHILNGLVAHVRRGRYRHAYARFFIVDCVYVYEAPAIVCDLR